MISNNRPTIIDIKIIKLTHYKDKYGCTDTDWKMDENIKPRNRPNP